MACSRQDSVTDEELFGVGRLVEDTPDRSLKSIDRSSDAEDNLLPNFSLLEVSDENIENLKVENRKHNSLDEKFGNSGIENQKHNSIDEKFENSGIENRKHNSSDFVTVFRSKCSLSAIEGKRKQFRYRSDIEVFEDDIIYEIVAANQVHVLNKSNSLPDLILSSSGSLSPVSRLSSDKVSHRSSDDLPVTGELADKRNKKEAFEGKSICFGKQKVSTVDLRPAHDTIIETADEGFDEHKYDESFDKITGGTNETAQDLNIGRKREIYSRSSGYQTESASGSQDKSKGSMQSQASTVAFSEESNELWTSSDVKREDQEDNDLTCVGNMPNISGFEEIIGSELHSSQSTLISSSSKNSPHNTAKEIKEDTNSSETKESSLDFKRLKTESFSDSSMNSTKKGNVPNLDRLHDSSVCIGQSTLNEIDKEENENWKQNMQQIIAPPGSLLTTNDPRSSITDVSMMREMLENCLKAGQDPSVILKRFQGSDSSTPSPSPADTSRICSPGQNFTCNCLQKASRCIKKDCDSEKACEKFAVINKVLEKEIFTEDSESELMKQYCQALYQHHVDCEELWCKVKYCQHFDSWNVREADVRKMISCIQSAMNEPVLTVLASDSYTFHMIRDKDRSGSESDLQSLIALSTLGTFGSTLLCLDKSQQMCVVKDYAMFDYRHQVSLYSRLCEKHPYVVDQMWILEHENIIQICSDFMPGGSLYDYMQMLGPLEWQKVMKFVHQMLSALTFLHKNGIMYLNWHSRNMLFKDTTYQRVKITNFMLSCPLGVQTDYGAVKQCLLPNISPPELLQNKKMGKLSDIWGVGCLVYELLKGEIVWSKLRHESREYIHKKIYRLVPFLPANLTEEQSEVFKNTWKLDPDERYSTEKLYDSITSYLQTHRDGL